MQPKTRPITIYRGDDYEHLLAFQHADGTPIDLTGATFTAQVRASPEDPTVLATMAATAGDTTGNIWLTIPNTVTATLNPGRRVWDVQQTKAGKIHTFLIGPADVVADVTRTTP